MRPRYAFTLIEVMMVVAVVGVLATMGIMKFGDAKRRAYITAMKSDLNGMALTAESIYSTERSYASVRAPVPSNGITLSFVAAGEVWTARATHQYIPSFECVLTTDSTIGIPVTSAPYCH